MLTKRSQTLGAFFVAGLLALGYIINLVIFTLSENGQMIAGGLFMIALGAAWIYSLGGHETLVCDRVRDTCRIVEPRFLLRPRRVKTVRLTSIEKVSVRELSLSSHDGPASTGYEVVLHGRNKVSCPFSAERSERRAQATANRIKLFLEKAGQESFVLRRVPWLSMAFGLSWIGYGSWLILSTVAGWSYTGE